MSKHNLYNFCINCGWWVTILESDSEYFASTVKKNWLHLDLDSEDTAPDFYETQDLPSTDSINQSLSGFNWHFFTSGN